jgi:ABC-type glycerol-3-phosphate transport system substrate-binding protein
MWPSQQEDIDLERHLVLTTAAGALTGAARAEGLTLCWAGWDPANALVELSKDFEAQSGNDMHFEFVPWPNFADRMLNGLNSGGTSAACPHDPFYFDAAGARVA